MQSLLSILTDPIRLFGFGSLGSQPPSARYGAILRRVQQTARTRVKLDRSQSVAKLIPLHLTKTKTFFGYGLQNLVYHLYYSRRLFISISCILQFLPKGINTAISRIDDTQTKQGKGPKFHQT